MAAKGTKLTAAQRKKVSEGKRRQLRKAYEARKPENEPTEKRCSRCGINKPMARFRIYKRKRKSGYTTVAPRSQCRHCEEEIFDKWRAERKADGTWPGYEKRKQEKIRATGKRREYQREWAAAKRRQMGIKGNGHRPKNGKVEVPVGPIKAFLAKEMESRDRQAIIAASGLPERRLYSIEQGECKHVFLATVDALLTGLGCPEEMHFLYPEEG